MSEARPLLFINKTSPGSDVAGETAAALAAASLVFKSTDPTYSSSLLKHAKQLFDFADKYTGIYSVTFPDLAKYYKSTDYHDELLWAAAWLYHATGDLTYLQYTVDNGQKFKGYGDPTYFSWDDKRAGTQVLLSRVHLLSSVSLPNDINKVLGNYRMTAESIMCVLMPGTAISTTDRTEGKKKRLLDIFGDWCDNVVDLIKATDEEAILRRDIYDRAPTITWGKGRVTLLGDSIHAMQPNLGQGGCMAIEDSYQLAVELDKAWVESSKTVTPVDVVSSLKRYEEERRLRVAIIHGMARMAAIMSTTYRPYLGVGLGPLSFLTKLRIPHPGRVGGRFFIKIGMPLMLSWVLGGNRTKLQGRPLSCRLSDKASDQLKKWFEDDDALEQALNGEKKVELQLTASLTVRLKVLLEEHVTSHTVMELGASCCLLARLLFPEMSIFDLQSP